MGDDAAALRREVRELTDEWREAGRYVPRIDAWMRSFDWEFSRELARRGLIGMTWPVQLGGGGRSNVERLAVTEELLRAGAPVSAHWIGDRQIGPSIVRHGSPELQRELLPGIIAAESAYCLGMSEPGAGSDLAAVATTATRVDGGFRVDGRKLWTGFAHQATHMYLLARTSPSDKKHHGLSELILDMDADGVSVAPIWDMTATHRFNDVRLDGVFVPEHRVIGKLDDGWRQVVEQLSFERGGPERILSTYPLLVATLAALGAEPERLGVLVARLATLRQMCAELAAAMDAGAAPVQQAATLKYLGNVFERDVVEEARRVTPQDARGPAGIYAEALLAVPAFSLRGGAAEVLLSIIAKQEVRS